MNGMRWFGRKVGYRMVHGLVRDWSGPAGPSTLPRPPKDTVRGLPRPGEEAPAREALAHNEVPAQRTGDTTQAERRSEQERLAAFMDRFCYVRSDYARQWKRSDPAEPGSWAYGWARVGKSQPTYSLLTPEVVRLHLQGRITVGTYLLDAQDRCRMLVLDHDDKRTLPDGTVIEEDGLALLQDCRARFAQQGLDSALLESRRGGHLFIFFDEPVEARDARALAVLGLGAEEVWRMQEGELAFEIYPKQDRRGSHAGAVGSNIALPLGVHLKDGQRHPFVDAYGYTVAPTLSGQLDNVETIQRVPVRRVLRDRPWLYDELERIMRPRPLRPRSQEHTQEHAADRRPVGEHRHEPVQMPAMPPLSPWAPQGSAEPVMPGMPPYPAPSPYRTMPSPSGPRHSLIARWKAAVDCRDIVRAYGVELNENGTGCCPFHDDQHASFQAWRDAWRCYAEDRGGDALQFVMEQERMSAREALAFVRARFPVPGLELAGPDQPRHPGGRG